MWHSADDLATDYNIKTVECIVKSRRARVTRDDVDQNNEAELPPSPVTPIYTTLPPLDGPSDDNHVCICLEADYCTVLEFDLDRDNDTYVYVAASSPDAYAIELDDVGSHRRGRRGTAFPDTMAAYYPAAQSTVRLSSASDCGDVSRDQSIDGMIGVDCDYIYGDEIPQSTWPLERSTPLCLLELCSELG
jgi:hypothetical protein